MMYSIHNKSLEYIRKGYQMNYKVNYEILHIAELEEALKNIDENKNQEEAKYIRRLIEKGGYKYPDKPKMEGHEITNKNIKLNWKINIVIVLCWVVAGVFFRWYNLHENPPLAGATFFIITLSNLMIIFGPLTNIFILWRQNKKGRINVASSVVFTGIAIGALIFLLAITGMFAFT